MAIIVKPNTILEGTEKNQTTNLQLNEAKKKMKKLISLRSVCVCFFFVGYKHKFGLNLKTYHIGKDSVLFLIFCHCVWFFGVCVSVCVLNFWRGVGEWDTLSVFCVSQNESSSRRVSVCFPLSIHFLSFTFDWIKLQSIVCHWGCCDLVGANWVKIVRDDGNWPDPVVCRTVC